MDIDTPAPRSRPLLLFGRRGPSLAALDGNDALRSCFQVATPLDAEVERLVRILRPTAVLLEASEFYLDGVKVHDALKRQSPETRVLFLDVEGAWALWIEIEPEGLRALRIGPCETVGAGDALLEFLEVAGAPAPRIAASA
jgi:hypothetical protein